MNKEKEIDMLKEKLDYTRKNRQRKQDSESFPVWSMDSG